MDGDETPVQKPQILTVRSSAGSGKTYRLAEHYLKVLLTSALADATLQTRVANIVAITFTNKASQEMRERILDWMKRIILDVPFENSPVKPLDTIMEGITTVALDTDPCAQESTEDDTTPGGTTDDEKTRRLRNYLMGTMENRFSELLKDFAHFNVGTIDSFVNLTLKASAMQLGLPPDFDVSTQTKELIDLALRECLQRAGENETARDIFDTFLRNYMDLEGDHTSWVPKDLLKETITTFWGEEAKENRDLFIPDDEMRSAAGSVRKKIAEKARSVLDSLAADKNILPLANALKAIEKCADPRGDALSQSVFFERSLEGCVKKGSALPVASDEKLWDDLIGLRRIYAEALAASKFLPYLEVYSLFKEVFQREVTYFRRVIPIEQLNRLLQDVMKRRDFVPEIYYALAERYIHFLIDEFQDTSLLQWKNIEVLAEEALGRGGTLFLVGDKKQAIYRWRGGRPDLVDKVASRYEYYPHEEILLDTNYRSGENVVFFNNEVFDAVHLSGLAGSILGQHPPGSLENVVAAYRDARQRFLEVKKDKGYVAIEKITIGDDGDDRQEVFTRDESGRIIEERLRDLIEKIMARNVFRERDIAVLVRTREEAKAVVRVLLSMNLNVESEYTVSIRNNPLIGEVMSFLRFIDKSDDDLSFASFITGRIFAGKTGLETSAMAVWLSRKYLTDVPEFLYHAFRSDFGEIFEGYMAGFLTMAGYLPLYDLVVSFFRQWEVFARFPDDAPYLLHFLELVRECEGADDSSITGFIAFFQGGAEGTSYGRTDDDRAFLLPTSDSLNAIKVLTIHKAKGLQFPVVILPFITLTTFGASSGRDRQQYFQSGDDGLRLLYLKKDYTAVSPALAELYLTKEREYLSDELNNLYVAFTRAEEELYVFLADGKRQKNHLIDYLFDMEEMRPYRQQDTGIVLGDKRTVLPSQGAVEGAPLKESGRVAPAFNDFTGDTGWAAKIKPGISDAGGLTRHAVRARKKGDAMHRALALIETLPVDDGVILSLARVAAAHERIGNAGEEIGRSLKDFFGNPDFRYFFEGGPGISFFNEREIVDGSGNTFKIDRIVVRPDVVEIIDYKTGETRYASHTDQIRHYGKLIAELHPDKEVKRFLLYIDEGEVVEV